MKASKSKRNLTLAQVERYNTLKCEMDSCCREQFVRNTKTWLRKHPEAGGRIPIDPDHTFTGQYERHGAALVADVTAVSFDADGCVVFDITGNYVNEKNVPDACDRGYGLYVEDWPWALQILLEHLEDPYVPEKDFSSEPGSGTEAA